MQDAGFNVTHVRPDRGLRSGRGQRMARHWDKLATFEQAAASARRRTSDALEVLDPQSMKPVPAMVQRWRSRFAAMR